MAKKKVAKKPAKKVAKKPVKKAAKKVAKKEMLLVLSKTKEALKARVAREIPKEKLTGAVLFWNGENKVFHLYNYLSYSPKSVRITNLYEYTNIF